MSKELELYAVVDNGELYYETLADSPREAVASIGEGRQDDGGGHIGQLMRMMSGKMRVHCVRVTVMGEVDDYFSKRKTK